MHLLLRILGQERDARTGGWIADLLERDQALVNQVAVSGAQRRNQLGNSELVAEDAGGQGGVGTGFEAGAISNHGAQSLGYVLPHDDEGVDHLVVTIAESAFDKASRPGKGAGHALGNVTRDVEVDQAVGGAHLNRGIAVAGGLDEGFEAVLRADVDDGLNGVAADVKGWIVEELRQAGDGLGIALRQILDLSKFSLGVHGRGSLGIGSLAECGNAQEAKGCEESYEQRGLQGTFSGSLRPLSCEESRPASKPRSSSFWAARGMISPASTV